LEVVDPAKQQRSIDTRKRILDAATVLFSENGFDPTSLRTIAEKAEVHNPAIKYHFGSKEELWVAVVKNEFEVMDQLGQKTRELAEKKITRSSFSAHIAALLMIVTERPYLTRIILREQLDKSQRLGLIEAAYFVKKRKKIENYLQRVLESGLAKPFTLEVMVEVFSNILIPTALEAPKKLNAKALKSINEKSESLAELFLL
jgi:AcrR family transcriptional regulator